MCDTPAAAAPAPVSPSPPARTGGIYRVFVGWDHAVAVNVQDAIVDFLAGHSLVKGVKSFGPRDTSIRVDYPDVATEVCAHVLREREEAADTTAASGEIAVGVLICGSGIGMSMAANKFPGIRAALCHDHYTAQMCRRHNDANVICAGARTTGIDVILEMLNAFLTTGFEGGRHATRVAKLAVLDSKATKTAPPSPTPDRKSESVTEGEAKKAE